jgi:hypothetical protein
MTTCTIDATGDKLEFTNTFDNEERIYSMDLSLLL